MQLVALFFIFLSLSHFVVPAPVSFKGLHVSGNKLVNKNGQKVKLRGVNRSSGEYYCAQGHGFFDGPVDQDAINAIKTWNVNAVRLPMNEGCWLGSNGTPAQYSGTAYQEQFKAFVDRLTESGFAVILDLHWTNGDGNNPLGQEPMPNTGRSVDFWAGVANAYKSYDNVIFDLFNEPFPDNNNWNSENGWKCWKDGVNCGLWFEVAGMQRLVDAVRGTGAKNVIMLGGLAYSNSLAQWLDYKPNDPLGNLVAAWHTYNFNFCNNKDCWDQYVAPVAEQVPIIVGELGQENCAGDYINPLLEWLDEKDLNYLAWTWNNWDCSGGPSLISDFTGTYTNYGFYYKNHTIHLKFDEDTGGNDSGGSGSAASRLAPFW